MGAARVQGGRKRLIFIERTALLGLRGEPPLKGGKLPGRELNLERKGLIPLYNINMGGGLASCW